MEKSQKQQVREWLESGRTLTPLEAKDNFGSMRLASIIEVLKNKEGMNIVNLNKTGSERYAKYVIRKKLPTSETPQEDTEIIQVQVPCQKCRSYYRRGKRCNICGAIVKP